MTNSSQKHPKKIYVELTTRCNLQCQMCVKYAAGSSIPEADMPLDLFRKLLPSLSGVETLILNGIGESLLHADLIEIVTLARKHLSKDGTIGLQSNGFLLSQEYTEKLVNAGLTTLCLSVDGFDDATSEKNGEHSFAAVKRAVENLAQARKVNNSVVKLGLEIVLTQKNIEYLPELVGWAINNGVDYILTSHLFLYDKGAECENLFNPHSLDALAIVRKYSQLAHSMGFDLFDEITRFRKHVGTKSLEEPSKLMSSMLKEAKDKIVQLNFDHLQREDLQNNDKFNNILLLAKDMAKAGGMDLFIPPLQAISPRECRFMSEKATFIAVSGEVMPCHFLWHTYSCRVHNDEINVSKRSFGNIGENSLENIWQSKEYLSFREEAEEYLYTPCWTCSQGPCASLVSDEGGYANDCYGSQVPCGHCQWNLGGIRCL